MSNICIICDHRLKKNSNFTSKCERCALYVSQLKPNFGAPVEGIKDVRIENFNKIFDLIKNEINNECKMLEVGPGKGLFMKLAQEKKIDITGIEPGKEEAQFLSKQGLKVFNLEFPLKYLSSHEKYDFIIFNDVLEHINVTKLDETINQCYSLLSDNGFLILNLPNSNGIFFKLSNLFRLFKIDIFYERLWQKNFSSPHMTYFNDKNLNTFITKYNFKLQKETYLKTISNNSEERISLSIKNSFLLKVISFLINCLSYVTEYLPKDIMLKIYKKGKLI